MAGELIRIFSDVHFGDPASRVRRLAQLRPLLEGVDHLVLNGDTVDIRPGPRPHYTAEIRAEVLAFFPHHVPRVTFVTGNHDAELSPVHALDLAGGLVYATHGDILYDQIVPWGRDAAVIGARISAALAALPAPAREELATRFEVWRRVAAAIPQRHQSKPRGLAYTAGFIADTVWPPHRALLVLAAWRQEPIRAAEFARRHRPHAKFFLLGHTHRARVQRTAAGLVVVNTGAFCPPSGTFAIDLSPGRLAVRRVAEHRGEFRGGETITEFSLATADPSLKLAP